MQIIETYRKLFENKKINRIVFIVCLLLSPLWFTCMPEIMNVDMEISFWEYISTRIDVMLLAYIVLALMYALLSIILRKFSIATLLLGGICWLGGYTNYYKVIYRDEPVLPSDIFQIKDALVVAGTELNISLTTPMIVCLVVLIVLCVLLWFVKLPQILRTGIWWKKLAKNSLVGVVLLALIVSMFAFIFYDPLAMVNLGYTNTSRITDIYYENMFFPSYFVMSQYVFPSKPNGYSKAAMQPIGESIRQYQTTGQHEPDIVIVVAESWFELSNVNANYSADLLENYHRLSAEGVSGHIVSPRYSGGTAEIEYEVLTGFSTYNTLTSTTAFNINLYPEFPGIVNYLKTQDYAAYSVHSFTNELYNRANAYAYLGFDESYFMSDFVDPEVSGAWISEKSCMEKVMEVYEQGIASGGNIMIHTLTMQNHLPYNQNRYNWPAPIYVESEETGEIFWNVMPVVASSLYEVDQAIGMLADYFREVNRDVILIVLGDHQSRLVGSDETDVLTEAGFYDTYDEERDFLKLHTTPYLVWANFDTEINDTFGNIPPNMLLPNALAYYNVTRPAYFDYFLNETTSMNGMTSNYVVNLDGSVSFTKTEQQQAEENTRMLIQYDLIQGKKFIKDLLY